MYTLTQKEWDKIPKDYKGYSLTKPQVRVVFEGCLPQNKNSGKGGTNLLFEHEHFKIKDWFNLKGLIFNENISRFET